MHISNAGQQATLGSNILKMLRRRKLIADWTIVRDSTRSTDSLVSHAPTLDFHTELDHVLNFSKTVRPESSFSRTHADLLVENGIAQKTSKPGLVANVPFTVIEQKATGLRQRFILWTKESNERLVDDVTIISEYVDSVLFDCASGRDFRTGFYQVEIPHDARKLFGFRSDDGQFFELTRLPMGHSCAPEIMHTLAATIAGHPDYVRSDIAVHDVRVDAWIDNIRYSGSRKDVAIRTAQLDIIAKKASSTWKELDSFNLAEEYDFLGVRFNHQDRSVVVSERLQGKLAAVDLTLITASGLESLMGRLMHASAVSGISPGRFWFTLKFIRRVINKINRGLLGLDETVLDPRSIRLELSRWLSDAVGIRITVKGNILVGKNPRVFIIFSKSARIFPRGNISLQAYLFSSHFFCSFL